jgi:methanethiol oxidase
VPEVTDPTFYRSPAAAIAAPPEELAYVAAFDPGGTQRDAMTVVDCDTRSATFGEVVGWTALPTAGNELTTSGGTLAPARCATWAMLTTARSNAVT